MKNVKILMTSPYPQMTSIIERVAEEMCLSVTIVEGTMSNAAEKVSNLVKKGGFEVIVSRAGTAHSIKQVVDLPVVHCDNSDFDILQAFIRANKIGKKIGFLTYPEEAFPYKMKTLSEVIGFEVTQFPYRDENEHLKQIKAAAESGIDVLVGGGIGALRKSQQYGMKGMYILTSERAIRRALIRATDVAQYRISVREKNEHLNMIIQRSEEGIIFLNQDGIIQMINPVSEKLFEVDSSEVVDRKYSNNFNSKKLKDLFKKIDISIKKESIAIGELIVDVEPVTINDELLGTVITSREINKIQLLESQIRKKLHSKGLLARSNFQDIVHSSKKMQDVLKRAQYFAETDSTILITGETGTGKELIAQGIHNASERKEGPFVAVNCAALPESLLESELFGYSDGAFTGAKKGGKPGLFELAHKGSIFLDEIGEIPSSIQARLLRVLQEREVMRVGGERVVPVNIRIIVATNRNLWMLVRERKFRSDLYFRINVLPIEIPPLRNRKKDISELVQLFLNRSGSRQIWEEIPEELRNFFLNHRWPGNVRQLENIVERYSLFVKNEMNESLFIQDIISETETYDDLDEQSKMMNFNHRYEETMNIQIDTIKEIEKQIYEQMLERYDHNRSYVAEKLGVSRTTLWKKVKELDI